MIDEIVVIIIPTFNEALVIEETITQIFEKISSLTDVDINVLIFDSQSADGTDAIVSKLQTRYPKLHLLSESKKSGLGSAYHQAMNHALNEMDADIVIEFDADGSHQPHYLLPILETLNQSDVVVGSRYIKGGTIPKEWGWHRKFISFMGNKVARFFLTKKYHDFTSGFRATRRHVLINALTPRFLSNHYAYKLDLFWRLHQQEAVIVEMPIQFIDRKKGYSKLPANSILDSLRVLLRLRLATAKSYFNMCLVGCSGALLQFIIYHALRNSMSPFYATQCAVIAALLNNFVLNDRFTFRKRRSRNRSKKIAAFGGFFTYSIVMIFLQSCWMSFATAYWGEGLGQENLLMMIGILGGSFLNYLTYSKLIWR